MADIKDFKCTYDNSAGITGEVTEGLNLKFPDVHFQSDMMATLSKALKEHDGAAVCEMPFCHTVEADAMGGIVNYGNEVTGPRAKEYICTSVEELLELPAIDFTTGRIHEVLLACRKLEEEGEHVVLEVSGPFTIMNVLIDPKYVFKAMRKKPELMREVFWKFGNEVLRFVEEAKKAGVELVSYADSSGGLNILGPKMMEQTVELFTYEFVKKLRDLAGERMIVLLCPKTTFALLGTGKAEFRDIGLPNVMSYGEACISMIGQARIAGQMCIKNTHYMLKDQMFKEVVLLQEEKR